MKAKSFILSAGLALIIVMAMGSLPIFGSSGGTPSRNTAVTDYYLENSLPEIGSANIVNSIVWDFRGYDTLGEETVLYTAVIGIFLIVHRKSDFTIGKFKRSVNKAKK